MSQPDHRYDSNGVCILCARCDDADCCRRAQKACSRYLWDRMDEQQRDLASAYFGDLRLPHGEDDHCDPA